MTDRHRLLLLLIVALFIAIWGARGCIKDLLPRERGMHGYNLCVGNPQKDCPLERLAKVLLIKEDI